MGIAAYRREKAVEHRTIGRSRLAHQNARHFETLSRPFYYDLIQLNFFSNENPAVNRMNVRTFVDDLTNYNLKAARNMKWEVRADFR